MFLDVFIFFNVCLFLYCRKNTKRQMTLLIRLTKYLQIFFILSGCLMLKMQWPPHPQHVLQLSTDVQIVFDILCTRMRIFTVCIGFFLELNAQQTSSDVNVSSQFQRRLSALCNWFLFNETLHSVIIWYTEYHDNT